VYGFQCSAMVSQIRRCPYVGPARLRDRVAWTPLPFVRLPLLDGWLAGRERREPVELLAFVAALDGMLKLARLR